MSRTVRRCSSAGYFGVTIASLKPTQLREIVFQIIPRKFTTKPSSAGEIIEQLRAFYAFLKREAGLAQADACLRVLGGKATAKLEAALSDPRNFGMAKSMIMQGMDEGFDVTTKEGLDAWLRTMQLRENGPSNGSSPRAPADKASSRARKQKRKTSRKSRKKNKQKKK